MAVAASDLAQLSLNRASLPRFAGNTIPEQLTAARDAALKALLKYVPNMQFDPQASSAVLRQVGVWEERNRDALAQVLSDPNAEAVPEQIRLTFGTDMAGQFIVALFTQAAIGLGPWMSGAVDRAAQAGQVIQQRWAQEDAETRLQVFGGIVKMDQDGHLGKFFGQAGADGTQGLGFVVTWPVVVLVVALVALAAVIVVWLYSARRLELNNRLMRDLCEQAQKQGDTATVQNCIDAAKGLQEQDPFPGITSMFKLVGAAALGVSVTYVFLRYGLPALLEHSERASRRREAYAR